MVDFAPGDDPGRRVDHGVRGTDAIPQWRIRLHGRSFSSAPRDDEPPSSGCGATQRIDAKAIAMQLKVVTRSNDNRHKVLGRRGAPFRVDLNHLFTTSAENSASCAAWSRRRNDSPRGGHGRNDGKRDGLEGHGRRARDARFCEEAARRAGLNLGDWLDEVIAERAAERGVDPADLRRDDRLDAIGEQIAGLARREDRFEDERRARPRLEPRWSREAPRPARIASRRRSAGSSDRPPRKPRRARRSVAGGGRPAGDGRAAGRTGSGAAGARPRRAPRRARPPRRTRTRAAARAAKSGRTAAFR